ncbi:MAG TPA: plastocyanin/azurin family copper-binding protein [Candidatus Thermoplasmatota archaeon]|jgi:plastocyanin|nr:plastocyanin/azurin family copper-binding protein [Candidatus Thermoplasmatota archaeon]
MNVRLFLLCAAALALPAAATAAPAALPGAPHVQAVHHVHLQIASTGVVFMFDPPVVVAAPGDTIEFHAHGHHSATSGIEPLAGPVEAMAPAALHLDTFDHELFVGETADVVLTEPGAYPYLCKIAVHRFEGMHGLILVTP